STPRSPTSTGGWRAWAGPTSRAASPGSGRGPTRGGRGAARPSTTTPAGASTTSSPPPRSPTVPGRRRWTARRRTTGGSPTTPRSWPASSAEPAQGGAAPAAALRWGLRRSSHPGGRTAGRGQEEGRLGEPGGGEGAGDRGGHPPGVARVDQRDRRATEAAPGHPGAVSPGRDRGVHREVELGAGDLVVVAQRGVGRGHEVAQLAQPVG